MARKKNGVKEYGEATTQGVPREKLLRHTPIDTSGYRTVRRPAAQSTPTKNR